MPIVDPRIKNVECVKNVTYMYMYSSHVIPLLVKMYRLGNFIFVSET